MVRKKDLIFIGVVILIATLSMVVVSFRKTDSSKVVVTVDGEIYETYDLRKDDVIFVEAGGGSNTIKIQGGSVSVIEASCANQICVHSYPLSQEYPGSIVCIPHKLVVEIKE